MSNPFCHVELNTTDVKKAKDFYTKLFDWKLEDVPAPTPDGAYSMIKVGEGTGGGLMEEPHPGRPVILAVLCSSRRHRCINQES